MGWSRCVAPLLATAGLAWGCGPEPARAPARNALANPSFDEGREPWYDMRRPEVPAWGTFEISDADAFDGRHAVRLALDSEDFPGGTGIAGAVQEVPLPDLPRLLRGHYRIDHWARGTPHQYVQVVVMSMHPLNFPEWRAASVQLAFVLTGVAEPPFEIANRRFEFLGPAEPQLGRWIPFEIDLHEAFQRHWTYLPRDGSAVRVFLEARFDGFGERGGRRARADVRFDALYLGD
jgi:hypothetical protein